MRIYFFILTVLVLMTLPIHSFAKVEACSETLNPKLSAKEQYFKTLGPYENSKLSIDEQIALAITYQDATDPNIKKTAKEKLARSLFYFSAKIAIKYWWKNRRFDLMDLIQAANEGLLLGIDKYDRTRDTALTTATAWRIRAVLLKYIHTNRYMGMFGSEAGEYIVQQKMASAKYKTGKDLTLEELTNELTSKNRKHRYTAESVKELFDAVQQLNITSFDSTKDYIEQNGRRYPTIEFPYKRTIQDLISSNSADKLEEAIQHKQEAKKIDALLEEFKSQIATTKSKLSNEKLLAIFNQRIIAEEPTTLDEIGQRFGGVSRESIRQLEAKLRKRFITFLKDKNFFKKEIL